MSKEETNLKRVKWYDHVVTKYTLGMYRHIWYATENAQLMDDLYQDAFVKIVTNAPKLMGFDEDVLGRYIHTIVRTVIIDYYRKQQRIVSCISCDWDSICENHEMYSKTEAQIFSKECIHLLDALSEETKKIMHLRIFYGMPYSAIAKCLNITEVSARKKYERGCKKARTIHEIEALWEELNDSNILLQM